LVVAGGISERFEADRDFLVCGLWKPGILTNKKIGEPFGVTSSSISHSVRALSLKLKKDHPPKDKLVKIIHYSRFDTFFSCR